jgi:hypothetical protein
VIVLQFPPNEQREATSSSLDDSGILARPLDGFAHLGERCGERLPFLSMAAPIRSMPNIPSRGMHLSIFSRRMRANVTRESIKRICTTLPRNLAARRKIRDQGQNGSIGELPPGIPSVALELVDRNRSDRSFSIIPYRLAPRFDRKKWPTSLRKIR